MAWKKMLIAPVEQTINNSVAYEIEENLIAASNSDSILIPGGIQNIAVTISFTGGATGKVQTTTDKINTVKNGSPDWVDWDIGVVGATRQDVSVPVTAIRAVQVTPGTMKMTARVQ